MATSTFGSNPGTNFWAWDQSMKQAWLGNFSITTVLGRVITVTATFAAFSGGGSGSPLGWKNTVNSGIRNDTTIGAGNQSTGGGGASRSASGDVTTVAADSWQFGYWCANGVFPIYINSGTDSHLNSSAIVNASGGTSFTTDFGTGGRLTGFGTYFIVETYVRRSGAWTKGFFNVRRGSGYSTPQTFVRRGAGYTQVGQLAAKNEVDWKRELDAILVYADGSWERALLRWDYDRPRYMGVGYPGEGEEEDDGEGEALAA